MDKMDMTIKMYMIGKFFSKQNCIQTGATVTAIPPIAQISAVPSTLTWVG